MYIDQDNLIKLLLDSYHKGFQDAGDILVELGKDRETDEELKIKFKEFLPK